METDALIVGAGGAGLMAALTAASRGRKVQVLDHAVKPGGKILVSGGGRCNFTNLGADASHYRSQNPHFAKSALARYQPADFISLLKKHEVPFHEKKLGQLFCDRSAKDILALLLKECQDSGASVLSGVTIESVTRDGGGFKVRSSQGDFSAKALVIASGGLSFPKLGATDFGYNLARQFGIRLVATSPALDGFVFSASDSKAFAGLSGLSLDASVTSGGKSFRENILFTHKGLSGPACLQASLYWEPGSPVSVNLWPQGAESVAKTKELEPKLGLAQALARLVPRRLAERWLEIQGLADKVLVDIKNADLEKLERSLKQWSFLPQATVGYDHAEVTRGGVDTDELSSKTMECNKVPGLYFIGEVVDVTGELGGYNFQWAWASAHAAGSAL